MTGPVQPEPQPDQSLPADPRSEGEVVSVSWARLARVVLLGTWALVILIHIFIRPDQRSVIWPVGYLLIQILATACLVYRAALTRGEGRLAWQLLAVSGLLDVFSVFLMTLPALDPSISWPAGLQKLLSLATGLLVLAAVLNFPRQRARGAGERRRILDGLLFAAALLFLLWVLGMHEAMSTSSPGMRPRLLVAYLNAALLGGGVLYMTSYDPRRFRGPLGWLAASALVWFAALSGWTLAGLHQAPELAWWWAIVGGIPLFQGLAACSSTPVEASSSGSGSGKLTRLLPYVPVVGAFGAMALLVPWAPLSVLRSSLVIFLIMVVFLILRQVQAVEDLEAARRTLEDRVQERTRALEQAQGTLLRTERMNTAALMGAGLVHDLNNLLAAMKGSAELAVMHLEDGKAPALKDLQRIASTADNASMLTRGLMGYVKREFEELAPLDLSRDVKALEPMLRYLLPRTVRLHVEVADGGPMVILSSRLRLEQMLVNLVANGADAMPSGGDLFVRVQPAPSEPERILIEVQDTGTGMGPETLDRIFEPFFTTKPPGRGTGLGLPSLKAMIEEGGGRMEVASRLGLGSLFRIFLPAVAPDGLSRR